MHCAPLLRDKTVPSATISRASCSASPLNSHKCFHRKNCVAGNYELVICVCAVCMN